MGWNENDGSEKDGVNGMERRSDRMDDAMG
jgi:hypothetical protein